ncbi:MAG: cytochrome c [Nannocystis sp.]|uniref:c-type cytochrome n=2 Tax=Nannocystis sp. TaxID=1962667 RepID=UPI002423065C|nr:cytochrome c [Nannocystis sp.]MBK9758002.1 cytochrome c [Nannocystis sp.]
MPRLAPSLALALLACDPNAAEDRRDASDPPARAAPPQPASDPAAVSSTPRDGVGQPDAAPFSEPWLLAQSLRYLDDPSARRRALERSLQNPANFYSRTRLGSYGQVTLGWDLLPAWNPRVEPVTPRLIASLGAAPLTLADATPLWDGQRPTTLAAWVALGERVFFSYPLRPEIFAEHALTRPALAREVGLISAPDGSVPGTVAFIDVDGEPRVGITCALCHSTVEAGHVVAGRARRDLDYGRLRLAYHRDTGAPLDPELARRMASWGPGRADITEDDDEDPVAIPDLWQLRDQTALTQAATLRHRSIGDDAPLALAIRQETQILHANRERSRPPRELAWALAMYLYSLEPPAHATIVADASITRGRTIFERDCTSCHSDPNGAGPPIAAADIGTDPALANGSSRGTGLYRPAPLTAVRDAAPYLHHGVVPTLEDLLGPARLRPTYTRGAHGPGPIAGHSFGTELAPSARADLIAYLHTR